MILAGLALLAAHAEPVRELRAALTEAMPTDAPRVDGTLDSYVLQALAASPEVRAAYAAWEREVRHITGSGALPEPTLGFTAFLRSVETRVGPQRARVSLQQGLPWPTSLSGTRRAAIDAARAAGADFDASALAVVAETRRRYWELWRVRAVRKTHRAHLEPGAQRARQVVEH
ncbi:MAG: TolC family protein, partial [Myxococcota bacterium]